MQILSIVFLTAFIFFSCSKVEEKKEVKHEPLVKTITEYTYQYSFGEPEQNGIKESHTVFRYDSLKHLIEKIKYDEDGVDEKVIYEYNSGGHLIKELEYASYMNEDDEPYTTTYVLDSLDRTFEMTKKYSSNIGSVYSYEYNKDGKVSKLTRHSLKNNTKGEIESLELYKYDNKGNNIELSIEDKKYEYSGKWVFQYNANNKIIKRELFLNDGGLKDVITFIYDDDDELLIETIGKTSPDNRLYNRSTMNYNGKGELIETLTYSYSNVGEPTELTKYTYTY